MAPTVLHVLPSAVARGAQVYVRELLRVLDAGPYEHHLVTLFPGDPGRAVPGFDPRAWRRLRRAVRHHRPVAVVAHGGEPLKYATVAHGGAALIYYKIGPSPQLQRGRGWAWRPLLRRADGLAAVSSAMAKELAAIAGVSGSRVAVIPNGRDPARFSAPTGARREAQPPVVGFVGHLTPAKHPERFVAAVAALRSRRVIVDSYIAGDGPLRAAIEPAAAAAGVRLLGRRDDVPELLASTDLIVSTSALEGLPGVLIEAGMAGVATVASEAGGVAEVIDDGRTGLVVPAGDGAALVEAMASLLQDDDRRAEFGRAARAYCAARFSLAASAAGWERLLRAVAPTPVAAARSTRGHASQASVADPPA